jgi:uncharacterized protein YcbX
MAAIITQVYRYPVKGLSAEPLDRVVLAKAGAYRRTDASRSH